MSKPEPFTCDRCGQKGNIPPGFTVLDLPEAVGTVDGMVLVDSIKCNGCGKHFMFPKGSVEIRRP